MKKNLSAALLALVFAAPAMAEVGYQHIRNATAKIEYGGTTFLIDPYLAPKGAYAGFEGTPNSRFRNPMVEMKSSAADVVKGVDAVIVTHTHDDHWDKAAQELMPKNLPVFVQNAGDAKTIRSQGFQDVRVVGKNTEFNKVRLTRIKGGQHGTDEMYAVPKMAELAGDAMGVVMQAANEKTVYIVGDTIWNHAVDHALEVFKPQIVVMNTGYAQVQGFGGSLIMGTADVGKMAQTMPQSAIIAVHMDATNHGAVSSKDMRRYVAAKGLGQQVAVPAAGEVLKY
ncbi:MBL fold metallo-hydrolase [Neisseria animalis]|uniref:MBL fold metallo-hydrolase n=1 Tax=Neisseria animalis TaxID=492 RepID=A0A5P3MQZ3_NEIAN|nr:MBL fold metallo-hydrolase [Neisseria animalis]QEY23139.1 MBL fold metallo-hydrolase [Neisseria animalis]ROW32470.1 MBL fold metallo-hydrolase [Neisseria animalis]VEE08223.1 putative exported protein, truncated [Neisseria animalis]